MNLLEERTVADNQDVMGVVTGMKMKRRVESGQREKTQGQVYRAEVSPGPDAQRVRRCCRGKGQKGPGQRPPQAGAQTCWCG